MNKRKITSRDIANALYVAYMKVRNNDLKSKDKISEKEVSDIIVEATKLLDITSEELTIEMLKSEIRASIEFNKLSKELKEFIK